MRRLLSFLAVVVLLITQSLKAQWTPTNGPYGGQVTCFAVSGINLFAGTNGSGVSISTNNGTSWTAVNNGLTDTWVHTLTVSGSNLFAGTWTGVFLSTNNGASWTEVNTGLMNKTVQTLAVSGTKLFAGTIGGGVFLSTNNGTNWTEVNTGLTNKEVYALAVSGRNLFAGTYGGGVFLSTDNGANWTAVNSGLTKAYVRTLAANGTNLFAGTWGGGVCLSTNNGTSWTTVNTGLTNNYILALTASGANIFAGTSTGVFFSANNGANWTAVNTGLTDKVVLALVVSGSYLFAGTENGGVCLSTNNGISWTAVNTGLINTNARALAVSPDLSGNLFAGTNSGVFLSTNNGTSWTAVNTGLTNSAVYALAFSPDLSGNLFAGTFGGGVFLSTNNGASWTAVNAGLTTTYVRALAVSPDLSDNLFAGTIGGGVFLSTNNGTSWTGVNTGLTNLHVFSLAISGTHLFAGTEGGGVFFSTNNGTSWTAVNIGSTIAEVYALAVSGSNLFAGTWGGGVFRSTDNGTTWTTVNTGLTNTNILALAVINRNLFAGTTDGVFISTNNGTSWTAVNTGMTNTYIFALALSGVNLFAGTYWHGVWRRPIAEMITPVELSFQRGLNLSGWFDEPRPGQININRYTAADFQILKAMGCQAVRVPINLLHMTGPAPGYELDPLLLELLDMAVDRAEAVGLFIVLLNNTYEPVIGTGSSIEPVLLATWTQMARHFKNRSKLVLYEVLNEPHGISDADWNAIQARLIQAIRAEDAWHTIVVTPANYSNCLNLDAMPDYPDNNLLYTFHFYDPYLFTHQGVNWGDPVPVDLVGVPFPYDASIMPPLPASLAGTWWQDLYNTYPQQGNEAWVKSQLDVAARFQSERNVALWCGEFGAYPATSSSGDRAAWTNSVRSYLEGKGIAWTFVTDWLFEKSTAGCLETDVDTMITAALGLTAPAQQEPASEPEISGFTIYDDFIAPGLIENGWFSNGEYDLYSDESPYSGKFCLKITGFEQYGNIAFRLCPCRDLSLLANQGFTLDFWIRCAASGTQIDLRFEDTKTSDPNDHPWRRSATLSSSVIAWDGKWHHLSIPLTNFVESGSWDNNQWYTPQGLFDWKATDRLTIVAEHHALNGMEIFFDDLRISNPVTGVTFSNASPKEFQLQQNYPNPFNPSTRIKYQLAKSNHVKLTIYNLTGQEIATLVNGFQAAGEHEITWQPNGLPSGLYFYKIQAGELSKIQKLTLLK